MPELVLTISARTPKALQELSAAYASRLAGTGAEEAGEVCAAAALRRSHQEHRLLAAATAAEPLAGALADFGAGAEPEEAGVRVARVRPSPSTRLVARVPAEPSPTLLAGLPEASRRSPLLAAALGRRARELARMTTWSPEHHLLTRGVGEDPEPEVRRGAELTLAVALLDALREAGVEPEAVSGEGRGALPAAVAGGALSFERAAELALADVPPPPAPTDSPEPILDVVAPASGPRPGALTLLGHPLAPLSLAAGLGELHLAGIDIAWERVWERPGAVPLPRYPFQRRRFWFDAVGGARSKDEAAELIAARQAETGAGGGEGGSG